jgi:hypothetical protein
MRVAVLMLMAGCQATTQAPPPDLAQPRAVESAVAPRRAGPILVEEGEIAPPFAIGGFGDELAFDGTRLAASQGVIAERDADGKWSWRRVPRSTTGRVGLDGDQLALCRSWGIDGRHIGELSVAALDDKTPRFRSAGTPTDFTCTSMAVGPRRIAVGAPGSFVTKTVGLVRIFERDAQGRWRLRETLRPPPNVLPEGWFGKALALDGDTLVVSAPESRGDEVFIYRLDGARAALVQAYASHEQNLLGDSLAVDGDWIAAGGYQRVTLFERRDGRWQKTQELAPEPGSTTTFGSEVALRGNLLLVGDAARGEVFLYWRDRDGPWQLSTRLKHIDRAVGRFGLALTPERAAIGFPFNIFDRAAHGTIRIFTVER